VASAGDNTSAESQDKVTQMYLRRLEATKKRNRRLNKASLQSVVDGIGSALVQSQSLNLAPPVDESTGKVRHDMLMDKLRPPCSFHDVSTCLFVTQVGTRIPGQLKAPLNKLENDDVYF
jgi:hypothetical protein